MQSQSIDSMDVDMIVQLQSAIKRLQAINELEEQVSQRERDVAQRERDVTHREEDVHKREQYLMLIEPRYNLIVSMLHKDQTVNKIYYNPASSPPPMFVKVPLPFGIVDICVVNTNTFVLPYRQLTSLFPTIDAQLINDYTNQYFHIPLDQIKVQLRGSREGEKPLKCVTGRGLLKLTSMFLTSQEHSSQLCQIASILVYHFA